MQKTTLTAMTLFTLLTLPPAVLAGSITYDLEINPYLTNGWTLSGTITTDGALGPLQSPDILSWSWTATKFGVGSVSANSTDIDAQPVGTNIGVYASTNLQELVILSPPPPGQSYSLVLGNGTSVLTFLSEANNSSSTVIYLATSTEYGTLWDQTFTEPLAPPGTTGYLLAANPAFFSSPVPEPASLYLTRLRLRPTRCKQNGSGRA